MASTLSFRKVKPTQDRHFLEQNVQIVNSGGSSSVVLVCEHASHRIPASFQSLGLSETDRKSHAAWDPGAMAVAEHLADALDAVLVAATTSRLVYDCNRPPDAPDAMLARSEVIDIPGNSGLSAAEKAERVQTYYLPFKTALADTIAGMDTPVVVTIHSFAPVYNGQVREVEIGVLHDTDDRLANAMLQCAEDHTKANVQRNQPYGPEHGVTHTLKEHAIRHGHLNVMLEIRNDLIAVEAQQLLMASMVAAWIADAFRRIDEPGGR